jgi:uncharacterized membrane protein
VGRLVIEAPTAVFATLATLLALLFLANRHPAGQAVFRRVPLLVFAYFVPTALSNTGVIPLDSAAYDFIKSTLLPASLVLLTLSVDVKAIVRLGRPAVILFLTATLSIVIGGPLAYLLFGWLIPDGSPLADEAWKGLAALSGSWIGGGANFTAIGESVGINDHSPIYGIMIVVDVAVASVWMAVLLYFAGNERRLDDSVGADRSALDAVRARIELFRAEVSRPTTLADLLTVVALSIGTAVIATELSHVLPDIGDIVSGFTWIVLIATTVGLTLSFTPVRRLEGAGASAVGALFLYLLVASIGAKAQFSQVLDAPGLMVVGAAWMAIHAAAMLIVWRVLRVPIFFAAVGSQANIGGAASAPVVAGAFHPSLAPVGALMGVLGYVLGTAAGLVCAFLLRWVHGML